MPVIRQWNFSKTIYGAYFIQELVYNTKLFKAIFLIYPFWIIGFLEIDIKYKAGI